VSTDARFAPGDWYAVVGDHVTVVLPVSQRDRVASLWDLADAGATAEAVLDALLAGGLSTLDHVALVAHGDDTTRLIVRGTPTASIVTAEGEEVVSASAGSAWAERLVTGATSIRVALTDDHDGAAEHALTAGIARVSVVVSAVWIRRRLVFTARLEVCGPVKSLSACSASWARCSRWAEAL